MIKRPLAFVCLLVLIIQMIITNISGRSVLTEPASSFFEKRDGEDIYLEGQVYAKSVSKNTQLIFLKNNSICDSKIIVYDSNFTIISIGQTIYLKGTITKFDKARNPGNFDQAEYYAKSGIYGSIMCKNVLTISGEADEFQESLYQLKLKWKELFVETMGEKNGNILSAMLLGEKREMDTDVKEMYQKNGIGHVLAISGLHISFIGLGIYQLIRKAGCPFWLAGLLSLGILSCYTLMIGFSVSVFRAYVMLLFKIGADVFGRVYDMLTALLLAAALTVVYEPLYLEDAGFYLSYGAILGIILVLPKIEKMIPLKFIYPMLPGLSVNLALFPVQLWYYYEFPIYSILLNLIVIPLMSVLMGAGMIGSCIFLICKPLGTLFLLLCNYILMFFECISEFGLQLPFARLVTGQPSIWSIVFYYIILTVLLCGLVKKFCLQTALLGISILFVVWQPKNGLFITMLDVGQGDGIYVRSPSGNHYFIDGGSSDVSQVGKYRIEPFLKSKGVGKLDYVFISHGDKDHYSGIEEMLVRQDVGIKIENLVIAENYKEDENLLTLVALAKENDTNVKIIKAGTRIKEDDFIISCIQPKETEGLSGNAGSMVLELDYNEFEMLCTGDVEEDGEKKLITKIKGNSYEVLKVAHHGSKYSTKAEFLSLIQGKIALISAGDENTYGHPHEETLERLENAGYKIYNTIQNGAVTIKTDGNDMRITVFH